MIAKAVQPEPGRPEPGLPERARLFVALDLPDDARQHLLRWRSDALRRVPGLRSVAPEALHVTLCFLGWRSVPEVRPIGDACQAAASGASPLGLSFGGALMLPSRRPRVLAVEIEDPAGELGGLEAALAAALSAGGWYAPEARPFLGHVTVARGERGARLRDVEPPPAPATAFTATSVTLYRSRLERSGARYEALRTIELAPLSRRRSSRSSA